MRKPNAKDRILETAGQLFHQRGYSEVGINEIIEKAETAKASFYQYYPSKEALCEAWLRELHDRSEDRRAELLSGAKNASEVIGAYFEQLRNYMIQSEFRGCPYSNTCAVSDDSCTGILELIHDHKESIRQFFRDVAALKYRSPEDISAAGDRLFVIYSGATTESQNMKDIWPIEAGRALAVEMMKH